MEELREQRWDDHRFYHRSRVNQAFHLVSACCFLTTYVLLFVHPTVAAIFGWAVAMWPRQIGHFFFEPKGFDEANGVSFETKEEIKVGFNLKRKRLLLARLALGADRAGRRRSLRPAPVGEEPPRLPAPARRALARARRRPVSWAARSGYA